MTRHDADAARDSGITAVLQAEGKWSERAKTAILQYGATSRAPFLTEDVRRSGLIEEPRSANAWGAVFSSALRQGIIKHVGYGRPKNIKSHGGIVMKWELA